MRLEIRRKSLRWSVETSLIHLQTAIDNLGPRQMAGYGPVDQNGQTTLIRIQDDLTRLFERVRLRPAGAESRSRRASCPA